MGESFSLNLPCAVKIIVELDDIESVTCRDLKSLSVPVPMNSKVLLTFQPGKGGPFTYVVSFFQLDENLEQWPHLSELVQCYRTDWVKDDNKYGHYESIGPISFQNQIFEGPDTDIETGELDQKAND